MLSTAANSPDPSAPTIRPSRLAMAGAGFATTGGGAGRAAGALPPNRYARPSQTAARGGIGTSGPDCDNVGRALTAASASASRRTSLVIAKRTPAPELTGELMVGAGSPRLTESPM